MGTIGLIGGMSWESTAVYYRRINEQIRDRLGGLHSGDILLRSIDFKPIADLQRAGGWDEAATLLARIAADLERGGADCVLLCTNTMHKVADRIAAAIDIPLLHVVDAVAAALQPAGKKRPLLLATRFTMEQDFYLARLRQRYGIAPLVPDADDRQRVHDVIFEELCQGRIEPGSRRRFLDIIARGAAAGADSVILGCTEIGLLLEARDIDLPAFDSTLLHADAAVDFALGHAAAAQPACPGR